MRLEPTERLNLTFSAGAIAASFAVASPLFASSLALGAVLEAVNFRALHRSARAFFDGQFQGGGPWVAVLSLRFALVAGGIVFGLQAGADPLALVLGLSIAMPATVVGVLLYPPPMPEQAPHDPVPPDDPSWDRWSVWRGGEVEPDLTEEDEEGDER